MIDSYLARQPIFDTNEQVVAYELLYRDDHGGPLAIDGNQATTEVLINSYIEIGLSKLIEHHQSYINVTRDFIINHEQLPPPSQQLVLEVLEDVEADNEVIAAVQALIEKGYQIALDDFDYDQKHSGLLPLAHIVKVDILQHDVDALTKLYTSLRNFPVKLLAEKVETIEQFNHCRALGFDLFQGYFLCHPKIMRGQRLPANQLHVMQLVAELQKNDAEARSLEKIIEQDVALSYKLLSYINSAAFSLRNKIESIHHAVVCLGQSEVRKWASMVALSSVEGASNELIRIALLRAKIGELLTEVAGQGNPGTAFMVGLFSTLDALMNIPLDELLTRVPISAEVNDALLHRQGPYGQTLGVALAYERGDWQAIDEAGFSEEVIASCYLQAVQWSDKTSGQLAKTAA